MTNSRRTIDVPVALPAQAECENCVLRLKTTMEQTKGVESVEFGPRNGTMTIHFDPDLLTLRSIEERAREACSELAEAYCHETLVLGGLTCADCAKSVERAVTRRKGLLHASANFATSRLFLEFDCNAIAMEEVQAEVRRLGYDAWTEREYRELRQESAPRPFYLRSRRALLTAASFVLLVAGSVLWLSLSGSRLPAICLLAAAIAIGGYSVARNGLKTVLSTRNVDMNVLMTVAVIGAMAVQQWVEAALVVVLFGLGETLESWAVERTRRAIQRLIDLAPDEAVVRWGDKEERVPAEKVRVGQVVVIKPGAKVPLDGLVVRGRSAVDESPITGESIPQAKEEGDLVYAGTINRRGSLEVRVLSLARESTLARLIHMVEEAQAQKAPSQRWVDSFARYYTPAVMGIAALTLLIPPLALGAAWSLWVYRALALLILACPCALVVSTPVSIVSAIGAASRQGVLIKGGAHLEAAGSLRAVAFDKTGTLTEGRPRVTEVISFDGLPEADLLSLAASIEKDSEHPLAEAILHAAGARGLELSPVAGFEALPGRGVRARLNGSQEYFVGNAQLFEDLAAVLDEAILREIRLRQERGETVVLVGTPDGPLGAISIADEIRPVSRQAVEDLRTAGVDQVIMLTGDNRQTAAAVAANLGLDGYRAELLPGQKLTAVRDLMRDLGEVAMIGDGVNDAPALAAATVGIAMGTAGSDTALETADIALITDDLTKVPFTIRLSRAARSIVRQNITFALALKIVASLLVFPGWLTLWMAVIVDTGGSLAVIFNGLRLLKHGEEKPTPTDESRAVPVGLPTRGRKAIPVASSPGACALEGCSCGLEDGRLRPS